MRPVTDGLIVPTASDVLTKPQGESAETSASPPSDAASKPHAGGEIDWSTFSLSRPKKIPVNAYVDEGVYDTAQTVGVSVFVEAAAKYSLDHWQEVLKEIVPFEDLRKAQRKLGKPSLTLTGRVDPQIQRMLAVLETDMRAKLPGFKLSRFMAAAMAVYAKSL